MPQKSIKLNFIMNAILRMSSFIFPLITYPYVARVLGATGNGQVRFAASFVSYFTMFACLGIPTYGIRVCAECRDDRAKLSKTVKELLTITAVTTAISYVAMLVLIFSVPMLSERKTIILLTSVSILLTGFGMEWFYQAIEEYTYITVRNLALKILSVVLMFLFVKSEKDALIYAGITVIGSVGSNIFNMLRVGKYVDFKPEKSREAGNASSAINLQTKQHSGLKRHLKPILIFFMMSVASSIYLNLDSVMLGFMLGEKEVGYYDAAVRIKSVLVSLVTALGAVLLPRVSYYVENGMMEEFRKVLRKSYEFVLAIALPLTVFFFLQARNTILIIAGAEFEPSITSMQAILPTLVCIGISNIIGMQILIPLKYEKYTAWSTVVGALVDLGLNIWLIPQYGALGAAIGTLVAEAVVMLVQIGMMLKLKQREYLNPEGKEIGKVLVATAAGFAALFLAGEFVEKQVDRILTGVETTLVFVVRLGFCAMLFFGIYAMSMILMKSSLVREVLKK